MNSAIAILPESTPKVAPRIGRFWRFALAGAWLVAALFGLWVLEHYANTAGVAGEPPAQWPRGTSIPLSRDGETLVMFVHPHCPCTRASMTELARIKTNCTKPMTAWVVFYTPPEVPAGWQKTDLWRTAESIPGTHVLADLDGVQASYFGAATSGQTVLYNSQGQLLFSGGITGARGHEGDNAGETAIEELVNTGHADYQHSPVFGCPIINSTP
jgi:hypothetical protein